MKSGKKILFKGLIFFYFLVPGALADTIVLKNGRELKVEKAWPEGDQLCFIFHGIKAGIPQSKVSRVETDSNDRNKSVAGKNKTKDDLKGIAGKSSRVSPDRILNSARKDINASETVDPNETCSALRRDGFCDLQWERRLSSVDGLVKKQTVSDLDDVVEYVRPNDILKIGDATLESVIYAFWRDQLYTVTIWTKGYDNFTALREAVFNEFGPGIRNDLTRERYLWSDALSDIMLDYIPDGQFGMLWLRSKEMDRQCRSSQLKGLASYLKWMRSRDQLSLPSPP